MALRVCVASSARTTPVVMVSGTSFLPETPGGLGGKGTPSRAHLSPLDYRARPLVAKSGA